MKSYIPIEYPKWIDGVLVQNEEDARARRAAMSESAVAAAPLARLPSSESLRMRRTRERRREGKLSLRCDISSDQIEALAKAGFIAPARRPAVARGVGRLLDHVKRSDLVVTPVPEPVRCCELTSD